MSRRERILGERPGILINGTVVVGVTIMGDASHGGREEARVVEYFWVFVGAGWGRGSRPTGITGIASSSAVRDSAVRVGSKDLTLIFESF